jgi:phosphatidylserine/phosphatidylglycerophosphate/cardiolipin synthase-like enzyme
LQPDASRQYCRGEESRADAGRILRTPIRCDGCNCAAVPRGSRIPAQAQEQLLFPSHDDAQSAIIARINAETVRLDIATWYLTDRMITTALINRHNAGVRVRVIGDRVSIFEIDAFTRREFEHLASNGVPIRLRYHPTTFPQIMHWKSGIFVGQGIVEFGSANWTSFELKPHSSTNFKDETVMFTGDSALVSAFKSRFDQFWADTTYFLDWPAAYERETGQPWTTPMQIDRRRLEPDVSGPSTMVWEQGSVLNNRMAAEINVEASGIDMVIYRLSNATITDALINRRRAGVPVRIFIEPTQYRQIDWPEYWLTGARIDQLWAAGARIRERTHEGLTHMKVLITSRYAMHGSSNFTNNWQRDHNYFIPASTKPTLYNSLRNEFNRIWHDTVSYRDFYPRPPARPALASPADRATGVSTTPRLVWNRTPWAVPSTCTWAPRPMRWRSRVV